jgi:hypothetical protein
MKPTYAELLVSFLLIVAMFVAVGAVDALWN